MLLSLLSVKGSPGVTTAAAALAAVGADERRTHGHAQGLDLVELDPAGGDIEPLTGVTGDPGLPRAASDLRPESLVSHAVEAPTGVRSLLAPTSASEATGTLRAALDRWGVTLSAVGGVVVADCGRWEKAHPSAGRVAGADLVAVVCRPDARGVEHVRHALVDLRAQAWPAPVVVLAVGDRPYDVREVAGALDIAPGGTLAWDPRGAAALWREGIGQRRLGRWSSSWLARSARAVLADLQALATAVSAR